MMQREPFIIGRATERAKFVSLEIKKPGEFTPTFRRVENITEARKVINELNGEFFIITLVGWLKARRKSLFKQPAGDGALTASKLMIVLNDHKKAPYLTVLQLIYQYAADLQALAPDPSIAAVHEYYTCTVLPIIKFCKGEDH